MRRRFYTACAATRQCGIPAPRANTCSRGVDVARSAESILPNMQRCWFFAPKVKSLLSVTIPGHAPLCGGRYCFSPSPVDSHLGSFCWANCGAAEPLRHGVGRTRGKTSAHSQALFLSLTRDIPFGLCHQLLGLRHVLQGFQHKRIVVDADLIGLVLAED